MSDSTFYLIHESSLEEAHENDELTTSKADYYYAQL